MSLSLRLLFKAAMHSNNPTIGHAQHISTSELHNDVPTFSQCRSKIEREANIGAWRFEIGPAVPFQRRHGPCCCKGVGNNQSSNLFELTCAVVRHFLQSLDWIFVYSL